MQSVAASIQQSQRVWFQTIRSPAPPTGAAGRFRPSSACRAVAVRATFRGVHATTPRSSPGTSPASWPLMLLWPRCTSRRSRAVAFRLRPARMLCTKTFARPWLGLPGGTPSAVSPRHTACMLSWLRSPRLTLRSTGLWPAGLLWSSLLSLRPKPVTSNVRPHKCHCC